LGDISVEGEISNFKNHSSGHLYFTLKDSSAAINCIMYRSNAQNLKFMPENGMNVVVRGYISIYEKTGQYQLYARGMQPAGRGALYLAFEKLKARLERAGVFDAKYKKPIPEKPKVVAVVTSPTGAAVRDIIKISARRNPNVKIAVFPSLVQGENAAPDIVRAIKEVNEWGKADTLIVGRGGGSIEDLWAFNEEIVARAIFDSKVPVISAVGHETDFTIADFIADMRASTPSAAAEIAVPEINTVSDRIRNATQRIENIMMYKLSDAETRYERAANSYVFKNFPDKIANEQIYMQSINKSINSAMNNMLEKYRLNFDSATQRLELLSPLNVLKKGYSVVYSGENIVKSIDDVKKDDVVNIRVSDGSVSAKII
jgi:exodeoxyribonuclease VII large subunit